MTSRSSDNGRVEHKASVACCGDDHAARPPARGTRPRRWSRCRARDRRHARARHRRQCRRLQHGRCSPLRPLPYRDADRLVRIGSVKGGDEGTMMFAELRDVAAMRDIFKDVAAYTNQGQYNASGSGPPEELPSTITTHNIFHVLGMTPVLGRTWPDAYDRSRHFSVVISDGLWQWRFGRDPVLTKTMTLDGADGTKSSVSRRRT